jgi:RnfABCDGE-type electron transport complex B subunit
VNRRGFLVSAAALAVAQRLSAAAAPAEKKVAVIDPKTCIACGTCAKTCPVKAILKTEVNRKTVHVVDATKCIGCGACVKKCPVKCIQLTDAAALKSGKKALGGPDGAPPDSVKKAPADSSATVKNPARQGS